MIVCVNNQQVILPEIFTIRNLLEKMGYRGTVAVWVNGQQILQRDYPSRQMHEGDKVRIIRPLGGG